MDFFNKFWCFMKLRPRTRHFWSVFVFTTNHMVLSTINPRQHDDIRHKTPVFWSWFWLAFWCLFDGLSSDLRTGIPCVVGGEHKKRQKWRVRGLSFIKHQKVLKNSTWAWSYVDLKKWPFFFNENRWFLCWPKIWQWYTNKIGWISEIFLTLIYTKFNIY